jgi:endonuclease/exonuclease/phosphatase family metal-dependent hydrolase
MAIKFISVNIERDRHIDKILSLIQKENPDVICFQEIMQDKAQNIASTFGYFCLFTPTTRHELVDDQWEGIAILSRYPFYNINLHQYAGASETPTVFTKFPVSVLHQTRRYILQVVDLRVENKIYRFANTHFTWSPDGQADEFQRLHLKQMLANLATYPSVVLSGDFNAPRGREIFSAIAERYKDNIPAHYQTSLDEKLHRCGYLPYVVDGLFSTPDYKISNVELVFGVSDHAAVRAEIDI